MALLRKIHESLLTTLPVLTEAFHLLSPGTRGAENLMAFIVREGLTVWSLDSGALFRGFDLMKRYADHPMDLADASLVTAAEAIRTRRICTIDRDDFETYRVKIGHRYYPFEILR